MNMRKLLSAGLIVLTFVAAGDCLWAGTATPESIMVVPARQRMVQLAFEISQFKEIGLVTYNTNPSLPAPLLHAWNGHEWIQISMDDYVEGRFMAGDPKHVFLLGDVSTLPLQIMEGPTWYKDVNRITTLDIATIVNQVGNVLHFSSRQWKSLAETYGMKIEDKNTERRRYGRWGAPGKERDLTPLKLESIVLPPAPLVTDPIMESKAGKAPATKMEEPKTTVEPVKAELPMPPKANAPAIEKPAAPVTVVEPVKLETPPLDKVVEPVAVPVVVPATPAPAPAPVAPVTEPVAVPVAK